MTKINDPDVHHLVSGEPRSACGLDEWSGGTPEEDPGEYLPSSPRWGSVTCAACRATLDRPAQARDGQGKPWWIHDCGFTVAAVVRPGPHACPDCDHAPAPWRPLPIGSGQAPSATRPKFAPRRGSSDDLIAPILAELGVDRLEGVLPAVRQLRGQLRKYQEGFRESDNCLADARAEIEVLRAKLERGHACTVACRPNAHVAFVGRRDLADARAEIERQATVFLAVTNKLTAEIAQLRAAGPRACHKCGRTDGDIVDRADNIGASSPYRYMHAHGKCPPTARRDARTVQARGADGAFLWLHGCGNVGGQGPCGHQGCGDPLGPAGRCHRGVPRDGEQVMTKIKDVIEKGQPIPGDVTGVDDCDAGGWVPDTEPDRWRCPGTQLRDRLSAWVSTQYGPLTVTAMREPECVLCRSSGARKCRMHLQTELAGEAEQQPDLQVLSLPEAPVGAAWLRGGTTGHRWSPTEFGRWVDEETGQVRGFVQVLERERTVTVETAAPRGPRTDLPCGHPIASSRFEDAKRGMVLITVAPTVSGGHAITPPLAWCAQGCGWLTLTVELTEVQP